MVWKKFQVITMHAQNIRLHFNVFHRQTIKLFNSKYPLATMCNWACERSNFVELKRGNEDVPSAHLSLSSETCISTASWRFWQNRKLSKIARVTEGGRVRLVVAELSIWHRYIRIGQVDLVGHFRGYRRIYDDWWSWRENCYLGISGAFSRFSEDSPAMISSHVSVTILHVFENWRKHDG